MRYAKIDNVPAYNPDTEETLSDRRVFGGNPPTDLNFNNIKYHWAVNLLEVMQKCTWFVTEASLSVDRKEYLNLTPAEKSMYDKAFSQIVMMDTFQTANISENVLPYCSAPEIRLCLTRQAWEEGLHSLTYATIANTVSPDSDEVFSRYKTDATLREKNDTIANIFAKIAEESTEGSYYLGLIANQVLEGIFFKPAFVAFFSLAVAGKMQGTASLIKSISRDEDNHLALFRSMIRATHKERPYLYGDKELRAEAMKLIRAAVELEVSWFAYITKGQVLGLSNALMEKYVKYIANDICKKIDFELPYPELANIDDPMPWVKDFDPNTSKTNFFEGNVTDYSHGSLSFDDL